MIDDMTLRRLKPGTQRSHLFGVRKLASFLGRSPHTATAEDLRQFQLHMASSDLSAGSINCAIGGLRFFFGVTLDQPEVLRKISLVNEPRTLPVVLTQDEVRRLLQAVSSLKYAGCPVDRLWRWPASQRDHPFAGHRYRQPAYAHSRGAG